MGRKRILAVDDDKDVLIFVRATLEAEDFEVSTSLDVEDGFRQWIDARRCSDPFDLLIADLNMPGERGTVLIKAVRDLEHQDGVSEDEVVPILLLTGEDPSTLPELESDDMMELRIAYLGKPSVSDQLAPIVRRMLSR